MKKLLFLLPLLCLNLIQAQKNVTKESLLNNKDISWVGEYELTLPFDLIFKNLMLDPAMHNLQLSEIMSYRDYRFSDVYSDSFIKTLNIENMGITRLKEMDLNTSFAYFLAKSVKDAKTLAYKDDALSQKINPDEIEKYFYMTDTLMLINPETMVETTVSVKNKLNPDNIPFCKAKLLVYYDSKNLNYNIVCTSIAPMIDIINNSGDYVNTVALFWIPVFNYQSTLDYSNSNINYAINTRISLDFNKADVVKSIDKPIDAIFNFIEGVRKTPSKHEIYASQIGLDTQLYKIEDLKNFGNTIDTVVVIDPETGKYVNKPVINYLTKENFPGQIRFEMNWYWDRKEQKLKTTTLSFAPIIDIFDSEGVKITTTPAFYKKVCKGKVHRPQWEYR
jgi:hypothetical protein